MMIPRIARDRAKLGRLSGKRRNSAPKKLALAIIAAACVCAGSSAGQELPPLDLNSVSAAAGRQEAGEDYAAMLPARRAECWATARRYAESREVDALLDSNVIRQRCLVAMIIKLNRIYYDTKSFGPGGIETRLEDVGSGVELVYRDIVLAEPSCQKAPCNNTFGYSLAGDWYADYLASLVVAMVVYNKAPEFRTFDITSWRAAWDRAAEDAGPP